MVNPLVIIFFLKKISEIHIDTDFAVPVYNVRTFAFQLMNKKALPTDNPLVGWIVMRSSSSERKEEKRGGDGDGDRVGMERALRGSDKIDADGAREDKEGEGI